MKKINKIVIIANGIIGKIDGITGGDVRFLEIAKHWLKQGRKIEIVSSQTIKPLCKLYEISSPLHIIPNLLNSNQNIAYVLRSVQSLFYLPTSLDKFSEGIVYSVHDSLFDVITALRLKLRHPNSIKWAAAVHWIPPFPPWKRKQSGIIQSLYFFINERSCVFLANLFADFILPSSQATADTLKEIGCNMKKVYSGKCGVDYEKFRNLSKNREKKYDAVYMKRIQSMKGAFDLIQIWKNVIKFKQNAKLLVIGGGNVEELKRIVKQKGLEKNIEITGHIFDNDEKIKRLSEAKIFLLPSYEENWAIVIGEAMAAGLPVIAYELKELKQVWTNHVHWVPLGRVDLFSKKALYLLSNINNLDRELTRNLNFIKRYDWSIIAKEELQVLNKL